MTASSVLTGVLLSGTFASRPAANAVAGGTLYSATDTGVVYQSDGSSWATYATMMLNPMTTQDDIIVGGSSGAPARLAKGTDGQVLTVDPSTHHLVWATPSSGFSDPMTTRGDIIVRNASNATARLAVGSSGKVLSSDGTDVSWGNGPLTTKGDIIVGGASGALTRLAVGSDGQVLTADSAQTLGVKWAAAGGGLVVLAETVLGSDTATIDWSSISGSYRHLQIHLLGRSDRASNTNDDLLLRFNNDSGSNYDYEENVAVGTTNVCAETLASGSIRVGRLTAATAPSNEGATCVIDIPNYAGTTFRKGLIARSAHKPAESSGSMQHRDCAGFWRSTSAITRITLLLANGNFKTGTVATLYGMATA